MITRVISINKRKFLTKQSLIVELTLGKDSAVEMILLDKENVKYGRGTHITYKMTHYLSLFPSQNFKEMSLYTVSQNIKDVRCDLTDTQFQEH